MTSKMSTTNTTIATMIAGAALALTTWATPAAACSRPASPSLEPSFGQDPVPLNAELWLTWIEGVDLSRGFELVDANEVAIPVAFEAVGDADLRFRDLPLTPGEWRLQDVDGDWFSGSFTVADVIDETPPAPPTATVTSSQRGGPFAAWVCGGSPVPYGVDVLTVAFDPDDTAVVLVDGKAHVPWNDGELQLDVELDGRDIVVVAVDHAGNESEVIVAGGGGGCASVPASSLLALASGLLLRRRRRP